MASMKFQNKTNISLFIFSTKYTNTTCYFCAGGILHTTAPSNSANEPAEGAYY